MATMFLCLAYFTRSAGLALFPAILFFVFFRHSDKKRAFGKIAFVGGIFLVFLGAWTLRNYFCVSMENSNNYIQQFFSDPYAHDNSQLGVSDFVVRVVTSVYAYAFYSFPELLTGIRFYSRSVLAFVISGFILWGFISRSIKERNVFEWYVLFYMILMFAWPWSKISGTRFVLPIIPFIFYYFLTGLTGFIEFIRLKYYRKPVFCTVVAGLIMLNVITTGKQQILMYQKDWQEDYAGDFIKMAKWAQKNTDLKSRFLCLSPQNFYQWSGRKSIPVNLTDSITGQSETLEVILREDVDYIVPDPVYSKDELRYLLPDLPLVLRSNSDKFQKIYKKDGNQIYMVVK